jgi:hexosaminidase
MNKIQFVKTVLTAILLLPVLSSVGQSVMRNNNSAVSIIPQPEHIEMLTGKFLLTSGIQIYCPDELQPGIQVFAGVLRQATGYKAVIKKPDETAKGIHFKLSDSLQYQYLGKEGYTLKVTPFNITVTALSISGIFNASQTLRQLLPAQIESSSLVKGVEWTIPCVLISDKPRYSWRGYMKDVSRTFYSVEVIKKYLDVMALYKLNVFHIHLTDDQGWRIEIKKYPKLTSKLTTEFAAVHNQPAERSGFYTQEQMKDLIRYAAERNITIVPEIDIPGHSWATLLAYPELGVNAKNYPNYVFPFMASWSYWGNQFTPNTLDPTNEKVYQFLDDVFGELAELFPSEYIHFGGDEVRHATWDNEPHVQQFLKDNSLKNSMELQSYFVNRVCAIIKKQGKKPLGWNDILADSEHLTRETAIMSWLGSEAITEATKKGFFVVAAPSDPLYFDITQADRNDGTLSDLAYEEINTIENVYAYEPAIRLTPEEEKLILGIQANFWPAVAQEVKDINVQNFPRLLALAEIGWIQKGNRSFSNFEGRLKASLARLDEMKIDYYHKGGYIAGNWSPVKISIDFSSVEWDVTSKIYANGRAMAGFFYTGGKNFLEIRKVELLADGNVVAKDEHQGIADTFRGTHKTKTYFFNLQVDAYNPDAKYTIRAEVKGLNGTESFGNFTFNLSPYKPFTVVESEKISRKH